MNSKPVRESPWVHAICVECWKVRFHPAQLPAEAEKREKQRVLAWDTFDTCCFCGKLSRAHIYVRDDPKPLLCKGVH